MDTSRAIYLILLIKLVCILENANSNEVLGCGGFIKSHADIDFSKVEIKLLTKQGALKDKTDCSPSNGYYFLPIYDKGDYVLRVSPPPGWSFEPEQFQINFDGKNDICSQGQDVNFAFKGFGITGKVVFAGLNAGANGVNVELRDEDGKDVRQTVSDINGIFSFSPVIPKKYNVRATHKSWYFSKAEHTVVVEGGNTELPANSLVVGGFDVAGRFDTNGMETNELAVAIFKKKGQTLPLTCSNAVQTELNTPKSIYEKYAACYSDVRKDGAYAFAGVAPGHYLIQPVVKNPELKLHIEPKTIEFEVTKDALLIREQFKLTGFSVSGRVSDKDNGAPLVDAIVKVNGNEAATTNNWGYYTLKNVKPGTYTIQVEAPQMKFNQLEVGLSLNTATIPDISPSGYEVCGKIVSPKSHVVGITKHASTFHTTVSSKAQSGDWCVYLPNGKFTVELITTEEEKRSGIQFYPVQQQIEVRAMPLSGIVFSQLRATLSGVVSCLPDAPSECLTSEVTLHVLDANGQPTGQKLNTKANAGQYKFVDILPGPYEITIPPLNLCFESIRVLINIAKANETAPPFVHKGYEVSIISSHRAVLKYTHDSPAASTENMKLLSGVNTFCVPKFGTYNFKLESCHLYDDSLPKAFATSNLNPVMVTAVAHKTGIRVLTTDPNGGAAIRLQVETASLGKALVVPTAASYKVEGKHVFLYETYLKPEETLRITPQSDVFLFTPQSHEVVGANDCVDVAFSFVAARGLILQGKVMPAIKDVRITLSFTKNPDISSIVALTNDAGQFKFGPIDENLDFDIFAEKESYVFSAYNKQTATFSAHKLGEIVVKVKDERGKELNGVLLSLSGAESYRKNLVTGDDGAIVFHSLSPAQYFLRPMMKEYKFEPNSKIIDIKDGETANVELIGKRVAYSAFGTITSLNGEPFSQVNVEATADAACMHHQEEATSENNGQYRLRGLQPGCKYIIRLKDAGKPKSNVERSIPKQRSVKIESEDVRGINLIAISAVAAVDVTARVTTTSNDHYKSLRVVMYRKGAADSPIYSQRVESPLNPKARYNPGIMIFFPRIPLDGKIYVVELQSTLSFKSYSFTLPSVEFLANSSSVFVELDFKPEIRAAEADLNQNSLSALVLVALVVIAFFKQDLAMDFLNFVWGKANIIAQDIAQRQRNNKKDVRKSEPLSQKEIEQMADQINAIKKKKTKKI